SSTSPAAAPTAVASPAEIHRPVTIADAKPARPAPQRKTPAGKTAPPPKPVAQQPPIDSAAERAESTGNSAADSISADSIASQEQTLATVGASDSFPSDSGSSDSAPAASRPLASSSKPAAAGGPGAGPDRSGC